MAPDGHSPEMRGMPDGERVSEERRSQGLVTTGSLMLAADGITSLRPRYPTPTQAPENLEHVFQDPESGWRSGITGFTPVPSCNHRAVVVRCTENFLQ